MTEEKQAKHVSPYIVSKRTPTQFNTKVNPFIDDEFAYIASGNLVNVYSVATGILVSTLRSKRQQAGEQGKGDVHKGNIISMALVQDKLITLCSRGVLAEWQTGDKGVLIDTFEVFFTI